jgi:hypothetical protein
MCFMFDVIVLQSDKGPYMSDRIMHANILSTQACIIAPKAVVLPKTFVNSQAIFSSLRSHAQAISFVAI